MAEEIAVVISRNRNSQTEHQRLEEALIERLMKVPQVDLTVMPHLYDLTSDGPGVDWLTSIEGDVAVLSWLYPRSTYWVLDANQIHGRFARTFSIPEDEPDGLRDNDHRSDGPSRSIWCFDLRNHETPEPYVEAIRSITEAPETADLTEIEETAIRRAKQVSESVQSRWYPVIDHSRCDNCMECLNFCLFGVYDLDASDKIRVDQPDACRAGCPACSRVCPNGAIMFPQHKESAIAGDPTASAGGLKLDLSQLFGGFNPADMASGERDRALAEAGRKIASLEPKSPAKNKGDLDGLVDAVDDLDL